MDEHEGDMAGFAKKKGWQSVAPEFREGKAETILEPLSMRSGTLIEPYSDIVH